LSSQERDGRTLRDVSFKDLGLEVKGKVINDILISARKNNPEKYRFFWDKNDDFDD
jgi:hypothetical protein